MMKARFILGHVSMLCLVLGLLHGQSVRPEQPDMKIDRLAKAYRAAQSELDRRAVCLDAVDSGVIARGRSVTVVDTIFGTTWAAKLPSGSELDWGVVEFHPMAPPPTDAMAAAHIGWFLAFQFDSTGEVQNYYLSNVHK